MAKITSSRRTGAQVPRPDRFVPAAGEERSVIRGQGDGCEGGGGAAVEVGGATGLYVSLFSAEWKGHLERRLRNGGSHLLQARHV